ncbi:MAG: tetratricopeptide repeat protein [Planctomycetaceae bacterium]
MWSLLLIGIRAVVGEEVVITDIDPPQRVLVVSQVTRVMQGDTPTVTLKPGQLMNFTKSNGDWRYTPEFRGWVSVRDVVPLEKSIDYFSKLIAEKPSSAAFHHRAIANIALGKFDDALSDMDRAIEGGDKSTYAYVNRGIVHRELEKTDLAIEDFTQAAAVDPSNIQAFILRGMLLLEQQHAEAALGDFDAVLKIESNHAEALNQRGVALRLLDRPEEARIAFEKSVEVAPDFADAYANRAFAECQLGDFKAAVSDYEKALELMPSQPEFMNDYAWLLATCRDATILNADKAVELAEKACESTETPDPSFLDTLAAAYARKGEYNKAFETATKALEAVSSGSLVGEIDSRRELYNQQKPFTEEEVK